MIEKAHAREKEREQLCDRGKENKAGCLEECKSYLIDLFPCLKTRIRVVIKIKDDSSNE